MDGAGYCGRFTVALWLTALAMSPGYGAAEAEDSCATEPYAVADDAPEHYAVFLPVAELRARELIVDSMMGIGFVQRKDRKGKMFAVRTNTNFGPPSMGGEQLFLSFAPATETGVDGVRVSARTKKTTLVGKGRQKFWSKPVLDHALCLEHVFARLGTPAGDGDIAPAVEPDAGMSLTPGTPVRVLLYRFLYSNDLEEGQEIEFKVAEDVRGGGRLLIAAGTRATGTVTDARKSGGYSKAGGLAFAVDRTTGVNGETIALEFRSDQIGDGWAGVGGSVLQGGLIGGLLFRGNRAGVRAGSEFTAHVAGAAIAD